MEYLVELSLVEWLPGGSLRLVEKLAQVAAKIIEVLPTGYSFTDIWVERKKLKIIVNETSSSLGRSLPLIPILAAVAAFIASIWSFLVLIGVVIIGWNIVELFTQKEITKQIIAKSELIDKATEAGLNPDQIDDLLRSVDKERISDVLKWIAIIGGVTIIGVGGIIAFRELRKVKT